MNRQALNHYIQGGWIIIAVGLATMGLIAMYFVMIR